MNKACTCRSNSAYLHSARCAIVQARNRSALNILAEESLTQTKAKFSYVTRGTLDAATLYRDFRNIVGHNNWALTAELAGVFTVLLRNGSEVTFIPESRLDSLKDRNLKGVMIEQSSDLMEMPKAEWFYQVDPKNGEVRQCIAPSAV